MFMVGEGSGLPVFMVGEGSGLPVFMVYVLNVLGRRG